MNITEYIKSKPQLDALNFQTVYLTVTTLIGDGILSMEDFQKIKSAKSSAVFIKN